MQSTITFLANGPAGNMVRHAPGGFFLGGLMSVLWTVLIVLAVLWVTRNWSTIKSYASRTASSIRTSAAPVAVATQTPLEILQTRYAKGEVTREEYETMRRDLGGAPAPAPTVGDVTAQA